MVAYRRLLGPGMSSETRLCVRGVSAVLLLDLTTLEDDNDNGQAASLLRWLVGGSEVALVERLKCSTFAVLVNAPPGWSDLAAAAFACTSSLDCKSIWSMVCESMRLGHVEVARALLSDDRARRRRLSTQALTCAAMDGHVEIVRMLMEDARDHRA
eukprot:194970-Chlamydomonas_euryale.AAC.1